MGSRFTANALASILAASLALAGAGCRNHSAASTGNLAPTSTVAPDVQKTTAPSEDGAFTYDESSLPDRYGCEQDSDCGMTRKRPGQCCWQECDRNPGTTAWIEAMEQMHQSVCGDAFSHCSGGQKCDMKGRPEPVCAEGRCSIDWMDP